MRLRYSLLLLCCASSALAQPVITAASLPQAGTSVTTTMRFTTDNLHAGPSGAGVTWDFSALQAMSPYTLFYNACPGSAYCATFPTANVVCSVQNNGQRNFFEVSSVAQSLRGSLSSAGSDGSVFSDPSDVLQVPLSYGGSFTDVSASASTLNNNLRSIGTVTAMADGWGTLITPAGVYTPVLRVKSVTMAIDSTVGVGVTGNHSDATYRWYSPSIQDYLMIVIKPEGQAGGGGINIAGYRSGFTAAVGNGVTAQSAFSALPNPAQDRIILRWNPTENAAVILADLTGRTIIHTQGRGGATLAVDALPRGLYILRVRDEAGVVHSEKVTLR